MKEILASLYLISNGDGEKNPNNNNKKQACLHPALIDNNVCAVCKKAADFNIPTTLPFGYLFRGLSLTVDAIRHLRDIDLDKLLLRKRLHLVLDIDNTLVHAIEKNNNNNNVNVKKKKNNNNNNNKSSSPSSSSSNYDDIYTILQGTTSVKLRPGARDFLEKASKLFDFSLYTMSKGDYPKQIAKLLKSNSVRFSSVISQEYSAKDNTKSLDIVLSHQQVTLIVDDLADIWAPEDQGNIVKIKPYIFFQKGGAPPDYDDDDQELERVWSILKNVHTKFFDEKNQNKYVSRDVRRLLRKN